MKYAIYVGYRATEIDSFASYSTKVFETESVSEFKSIVTLIGADAEFNFLKSKKTGVVASMSQTFRDLTAKTIKAAKLPAMPKLLKAAKDEASMGIALMIER